MSAVRSGPPRCIHAPTAAVMDRTVLCLLFFAVVGASSESNEDDYFHCPEETSRVLHPRYEDDHEVTWPKSFTMKQKKVVTEPLCLTRYGEPISRICLMNHTFKSPIWHPTVPPTCYRTQPSFRDIDKCPYPYKNLKGFDWDLCILVTDPQRYSDTCLSSGYDDYLLDLHHDTFSDLLEHLRLSGVSKVWLPVKRYGSYGPLLMRLAGEKWGDRFKMPNDLPVSWVGSPSLMKGQCLYMNIPNDTASEATLETGPCDQLLPEVCHLKLSRKMVTQLACPENSYTSLYSGVHQKTCLSVNYGTTTWSDANSKCLEMSGHLAVISTPFQNYLLEKILDGSDLGDDHEHCWIGLRKKIGGHGFEWISSENNSIDAHYINWDKDIFLNEWGERGAVYKDGSWVLVSDSTLNCFICQVNATMHQTTFSLRLNYESNKLFLSVYSPRGLWKRFGEDRGFQCFTDSTGNFISKVSVFDHWHKHWTVGNLPTFSSFDVNNPMADININMETSVYILNVRRNSGHYWCEGHSVSTFSLKRSKEIFLFGSRPGHLFSLVVDIRGICNVTVSSTICESTFSDIYTKISKDIKGIIENKSIRSSVTNIRPLKILTFTDDGTLRLVLHVRLNIRGSKNELIYKETVRKLNKILSSNSSYYHLISFLSTEGCPESITIENGQILHWDITQFGYTTVPKEICLNTQGIPVHRKCEGSFLLGGVWGETRGSCSDNNGSLITQRLQKLVNESEKGGNKSSTDIAVEISHLTTVSYTWLVPADIYYLARVMQNLARISSETLSSNDDIFELEAITKIIDCVNEADRHTVQMSQDYLNSTNMLLDALDSILNYITLTAKIEENKGVILCVTPQVVVQISDPTQSNISGLAITRKKQTTFNTKNFNDYEIIPLSSNETMDSIMLSDDIEVATWVPDELLNLLLTNDNNTINCNESTNPNEPCQVEQPYDLHGRKPFVVILVLYDDILFHSRHELHKVHNRSDSLVGSRVVSVSIPGLDSDLPVPISIFFKPLINTTESLVPNAHKCAFWDFSFNSSSPSLSLGGWSSEGCFFAGSSTANDSSAVDVCLCTHLTHFAELVLGPSAYEWQDSRLSAETDLNPKVVYLLKHLKALDIISIIGCSLSLVGILGIAVTAVVFRSWRDKPGTKILLQLALAIGLQMITFLIANIDTSTTDADDKNNVTVDGTQDASITYNNSSTANDGNATTDEIFCIIGGVVRHYSVICGFTWMLVTAFLQFQRYVKVLGNTRPNRFFLKAALIGWGLPLLPIIILLTITPKSYVPPYRTSMCYPTGLYLYLGVVFPAAVIISINFIVFVKVINSILRGPDGKVRSTPDRSLIMSQLKLGVLLFSLLGLSWFFGLMLVFNESILFSYLFCLTATTQGLVAFLFFVVCDPSTRHLWTSLVSMWAKVAWRVTVKQTKGLSKKTNAPNKSNKQENDSPPSKTSTEESTVSERKIGRK